MVPPLLCAVTEAVLAPWQFPPARALAAAALRRHAPARGLRQHASPYQPKFYAPPTELVSGVAWDPQLLTTVRPAGLDGGVHVEIGCAAGEWLAGVAAAHPRMLHVGFEIREAAAHRAARAARGVPHSNINVLHTNPRLAPEKLFPAGGGCVDVLSLLHPDPGYKARHEKRRFLAGGGVALAAWLLRPCTGVLLLQTDERFLMEWMLAAVEAAGGGDDAEGVPAAARPQPWFERVRPDPPGPPLGRLTAREAYVRAAGGAIYRAAFTRTDVPCALPPAPPRPPPQVTAAAQAAEAAARTDARGTARSGPAGKPDR